MTIDASSGGLSRSLIEKESALWVSGIGVGVAFLVSHFVKFGKVYKGYLDVSVVDFISFFVISALVAMAGGVRPVDLLPVGWDNIGFKELCETTGDLPGGLDTLGCEFHTFFNLPPPACTHRFDAVVFPFGF